MTLKQQTDLQRLAELPYDKLNTWEREFIDSITRMRNPKLNVAQRALLRKIIKHHLGR